MRALSIFIFLTCFGHEVHKQTNVHWLDGPMRGNRKPPCGGVTENDVAGSMLVMIDAHASRDNLQILDLPITGVSPHLADDLRGV